MIKFINILLLTLVVGAANATDKIVYMELETENNGYSIDLDCKVGKFYNITFKLKTNIIQNYIGESLSNDFITIETESNSIRHLLAGAKSKSEIFIQLNEYWFKKFATAGSGKIYIDASLFDSTLITDTYIKSKPYDSSPYNVFPGAGAFTYVKPRLSISLNNSDELIRKCNSEHNAQAEKYKHEKRQRELKLKKEFKTIYAKAQKGDLEAQRSIGVAYVYGLGTLKDYKKGMNWLKKAAEKGNAAAQSDLGGIYATGSAGVLKDMNKAKHWIEKGHANGDPKAKEYWDKFELWKY